MSRGILDGLLLQTVLAGPAAIFHGRQEIAVALHQDARENLAAGHVLLQRKKLLRPHNHRPE